MALGWRIGGLIAVQDPFGLGMVAPVESTMGIVDARMMGTQHAWVVKSEQAELSLLNRTPVDMDELSGRSIWVSVPRYPHKGRTYKEEED